jgi:hypothetical protein
MMYRPLDVTKTCAGHILINKLAETGRCGLDRVSLCPP